jgi:hypothetical protein
MWGWLVPMLLDERVDSLLCKDNIPCNKVYIIKTSVFCIHILVIYMTTWSWAYIWWASGFDLNTDVTEWYQSHVDRRNASLVRRVLLLRIPRSRPPLPPSTKAAPNHKGGSTSAKTTTSCFNYGQVGYFANQCPDQHQLSTPTQGNQNVAWTPAYRKCYNCG